MPQKASGSSASLSKSLYVRGLQCHKSLYLEKYHPELKSVDSGTEALFETGHQVGDAALGLFPGGIMVPYSENGVDVSKDEQIRRTEEAMAKGAKVIYEATFRHDNIFVKVDILKKGRHGWEMYEVKSGTKMKEVYVDDAALQYYVLSGAGVKVAKICIAHINIEYVRKGALDYWELFNVETVTKQVSGKQAVVREELKKQRKMLAVKLPPKIDIGSHCSDPYECCFMGHCWEHIPEDSVFELAGKGIDKFAYYYDGIVRQKDIPLDNLNSKQRQQVEASLKKKNHLDKSKVKAFLDTIWYPLYYLDFETFMSPIPQYDGLKPYQQTPFQYSLHFQKKKGGKLYHKEFLAEPGVDPRKPFLERLLTDIPEDACILAYNMAFEKGVLKELAKLFPKRKKEIARRIENMRDLMAPFRERHVYHWRMKGSFSIKKVLPALVPELSYDGLEIADGGAAMEAYHTMCTVKDKPEELEKVRRNLSDYCRLDTLGMVSILNALQQLLKVTEK